jgi:hypothetical protein
MQLTGLCERVEQLPIVDTAASQVPAAAGVDVAARDLLRRRRAITKMVPVLTAEAGDSAEAGERIRVDSASMMRMCDAPLRSLEGIAWSSGAALVGATRFAGSRSTSGVPGGCVGGP